MSKGMTPIDDTLYEYIHNVSLRESELQARLRQETAELGGISRMQIAPEQGQFMALLIELMGAKKVLEVGTFTGYSALSCALALPDDGKLIACDLNETWASIGMKYWKEAGVDHKIDLRLGPAAQTLKTLLGEGRAATFDLMFIDADKENYDTYYEYGLQLVKPGGLILIDNVLWGGAVADPTDHDADTEAIRALNRKLRVDARVSLSMLPLADGLTLARRRG